MTRRLRAVTFLVAAHVFALVAFAATARAEGPPSRVALVRSSSSSDPVLHEATTRVRAELVAAGFDVVEVERAPGDPRSEVEDAAPDASCFATIAMSRAANGAFADVWISDRLTGKTVVRRLEVGADENATSVLAIRTLELLRASLLEVAAKVQPAGPPVSAPSDVVRWIAPSLPAPPPVHPLRGPALAFGALGLHGLRGIGPAIGPAVGFSLGFGPWFARASFAGPLLGPVLQTAEGSATVRQEMAALAFGWASVPRPVGFYAWVGAGGFDLHTDGSASVPYRGTSGDVVSFLTTAGIGGLLEVASRVGVTLDFTTLFLVPQPIVVIAGRDAGSAGSPSLGASLGLVVGL